MSSKIYFHVMFKIPNFTNDLSKSYFKVLDELAITITKLSRNQCKIKISTYIMYKYNINLLNTLRKKREKEKYRESHLLIVFFINLRLFLIEKYNPRIL